MDNTNKFNSSLSGLVAEIRKVCIQEKIPCFLSFAVKDDGTNTEYVNEMVSATLVDQILSDDQIAEHANVMLGINQKPVLEEDDSGIYLMQIPEIDLDEEGLS